MAGKYTMRPLDEGVIPPEQLVPLVNHPTSRSPFYRALERIQRTMEPGRWIEFATYERARTAQEIVDAVSTGERQVPEDGGVWEFRAMHVRLQPGEHEGTGTITGSRLFCVWRPTPSDHEDNEDNSNDK